MHTIRLRGPWQKVEGSDSTATRVTVPETQHGDGLGESATYKRNFNRPTGLTGQDRVSITISDWEGKLEQIAINDNVIEHDDKRPLRAEITPHLELHNVLAITLAGGTDSPARLSGEVTLQIET